jgi:uncharacterized protein with PQ loop repeat
MRDFLNKKTVLIEKIVGVVVLIYPLTAVPQIVKIWVHKNATGVSVLTWILFLLMIVPLICYSVIKKEHKLTFMWSSWAIIYVVVIVGTILYGY